MDINWLVRSDDILAVQNLIRATSRNKFVKERIRRNVTEGSELYVPVVELMDTKKVSSGVYGFCAALTLSDFWVSTETT
jgi:hypothetical protein